VALTCLGTIDQPQRVQSNGVVRAVLHLMVLASARCFGGTTLRRGGLRSATRPSPQSMCPMEPPWTPIDLHFPQGNDTRATRTRFYRVSRTGRNTSCTLGYPSIKHLRVSKFSKRTLGLEGERCLTAQSSCAGTRSTRPFLHEDLGGQATVAHADEFATASSGNSSNALQHPDEIPPATVTQTTGRSLRKFERPTGTTGAFHHHT
jgi:hypothetical protein